MREEPFSLVRRSKKEKGEKKEKAVHSRPVRAVVESVSPGTVSKGPDKAVHSQPELTVAESDANTESRESDRPPLAEAVAESVSQGLMDVTESLPAQAAVDGGSDLSAGCSLPPLPQNLICNKAGSKTLWITLRF